jgi:hypothetical protein
MGWDAHSSAKKDWENNKLKDPTTDKLFKNAELYVKRKSGTVDGYLRMAGLDCSACAEMLEKATGKSAWSENDWNKDFVKRMNEKANWDFDFSQEDSWAYWSARKFLQTCAKANLSISFSW